MYIRSQIMFKILLTGLSILILSSRSSAVGRVFCGTISSGSLDSINGELLVNVGQVNIGLMEGNQQVANIGIIPCLVHGDAFPCPADLTGDDQVNIDDIFVALGLWGTCPNPCPPFCPGDLTEDCTINIDDIFAILGWWGPCE